MEALVITGRVQHAAIGPTFRACMDKSFPSFRFERSDGIAGRRTGSMAGIGRADGSFLFQHLDSVPRLDCYCSR